MSQAQKSAVFREFALPAITKSEDAQKFLTTLKTKCNIDPMVSASRLTAGVKIVDNDNADFVGVLHGIEKSKAIPCIDQIGLDPERVNVNGGAIAWGHPLGASGARLVLTLMIELQHRAGQFGLASMCIGVGQGIAVVIERT